jgi:hypothetical protein
MEDDILPAVVVGGRNHLRGCRIDGAGPSLVVVVDGTGPSLEVQEGKTLHMDFGLWAPASGMGCGGAERLRAPPLPDPAPPRICCPRPCPRAPRCPRPCCCQSPRFAIDGVLWLASGELLYRERNKSSVVKAQALQKSPGLGSAYKARASPNHRPGPKPAIGLGLAWLGPKPGLWVYFWNPARDAT